MYDLNHGKLFMVMGWAYATYVTCAHCTEIFSVKEYLDGELAEVSHCCLI